MHAYMLLFVVCCLCVRCLKCIVKANVRFDDALETPDAETGEAAVAALMNLRALKQEGIVDTPGFKRIKSEILEQ